MTSRAEGATGSRVRSLVACAIASAVALAACATRPAAAPARSPATAAAGSEQGEAPAGEDVDDEDGPAGAEDVEGSGGGGEGASGPCGEDMALVEVAPPGGTTRRYCIDKYEASLVEILPDGVERPFPHYSVVDGHDVVAVSRPHVYPQGYISELQAEDACGAAHKRLCTHDEWKTACMGPARTTFPYGAERRAGACHDLGKSAVGAVFGAKALASPVTVAAAVPAKAAGSAAKPAAAREGKRAHVTRGRAASTTKARATAKAGGARGGPGSSGSNGSRKEAKAGKPASSTKKAPVRRTGRASAKPASIEASVWTRLNDPALGQVDGALSRTGEHPECVNGFGVFDMVGNLHEWVATDRAAEHGTFAGGYYLDTTINGDGCNYKTQAHAHEYHDYSTGFRCCKDAP